VVLNPLGGVYIGDDSSENNRVATLSDVSTTVAVFG
jgi:hypothetical protein